MSLHDVMDVLGSAGRLKLWSLSLLVPCCLPGTAALSAAQGKRSRKVWCLRFRVELSLFSALHHRGYPAQPDAPRRFPGTSSLSLRAPPEHAAWSNHPIACCTCCSLSPLQKSQE